MNKIDKLNLIQTAKELYTNTSFRRVCKSTMPNRFLLLYYVREYAKEKVVFTIDFKPNSNCVTILDWHRVIWSKVIKDKLTYYFKLLGFEVR